MNMFQNYSKNFHSTITPVKSYWENYEYERIRKAIVDKTSTMDTDGYYQELTDFHKSSPELLFSEHGATCLELLGLLDQESPDDTHLIDCNGQITPVFKNSDMVEIVSKIQQKREEINNRIQKAAIYCFARDGLNGASTKDIADEAGISKAQLHYYINSKEDLYIQVLEKIMNEWDDIYIDATQSEDPKTVLETYITKKLDHALENLEATRMVGREIISGAPLLRQHWPEFRKRTDAAAQLIQSWIDAGKINPVDPYILQISIWSITQHFAEYEAQTRFVLEVEENEQFNRDKIAHEVTQLFLSRCGLS